MVRAKFKCTRKASSLSNVQDQSTGKYAEKEVGTVYLSAVYGDENKPWSVYTPSGQIEMTINNPAAYESFKLGQEYWIDFTPFGASAEVPEPPSAAVANAMESK